MEHYRRIFSKVPTLRFEKYTDFWQVNSFDNTFEFLSNNTLSRAELNYDTGVYKNIHYGDVLIKFSAFTNVEGNDVPFVNNSITNKTFIGQLLKNGDIVIADTAEDYTVGKATEIENAEKQYVVSGLHTIPCRPKFYFSSRFLGYYINSPSFHNQLIPYIQGVKVSSISKAHIKNTLIYFPKLDEQEKIACFLSLIDARIETQNKIISKYETLIKGITDSLVNEKIAPIKFEKLYSKASEGGTPSTEKAEYYTNGSIPFIKIDDLNEKYITTNKDYITNQGLNNSSAWLIPQNSVIFSNGATIGKISINTYPVATKQGILGIVPSDLICTEYLYSYMQSKPFRKQIKRITVRGTMDCAYLKDLNNIYCYIPSLAMQHRMVNVLSAIHKKLIAERKLLHNLKEQKKYLLSKMFI